MDAIHGWHLHKNAEENPNRFMVQSHDQPRTARLPSTDHHYRETTASSSGRSCDEVAKHSPALEARWPSEKPTATRQNVIENDTKHSGTILLIAMKNRKDRKEIITSPR